MLFDVKDLTIYYGMVKAIESISFHIAQGEFIAFIGPNGAGKSTTLKAVSGTIKAWDGRIEKGDIFFKGENTRGLRADELVKKGISLVPEGRRVFSSMTVLENLEMGAFTRNDKKAIKEDIEKVFELFPKLKERTKQKASTLSGGEQQMLAVGRALMLKPELIFLDEPSVGLSPNYVETIFEKLKEINKSGTTILVVEQNARMALEYCNRAYVFDIGKIAMNGKKEELINDDRIKRVYLGG